MVVAGIDFSSHYIDVVLVDHDGRQPPRWHRYPLTGQDAFDRARSVADAMPGRSSVYWDNIVSVGIEQPTGKFKPGTGYRIQGAVLSQIPARMLVQPWTPAGWRKAVGLAGNSSKEDVRVHVLSEIQAFARENWRAATYDATDAYCIALATRQAITQQEAA